MGVGFVGSRRIVEMMLRRSGCDGLERGINGIFDLSSVGPRLWRLQGHGVVALLSYPDAVGACLTLNCPYRACGDDDEPVAHDKGPSCG